MAGQSRPTTAPALGRGICHNRAPAMPTTRQAADRPLGAGLVALQKKPSYPIVVENTLNC